VSAYGNPIAALTEDFGIPHGFAAPVTPAQSDSRTQGNFTGNNTLGNLTQTVMNTATSTNTVNAAGTSENVAMHVAVMVATAMVFIFILHKSGFRFVAAAGIGG
jgi:hypothetical protein